MKEVGAGEANPLFLAREMEVKMKLTLQLRWILFLKVELQTTV